MQIDLVYKELLEFIQKHGGWIKKNKVQSYGFDLGFAASDIRKAVMRIEYWNGDVASYWDKEQRCVLMMWSPFKKPAMRKKNQSALDEWFFEEFDEYYEPRVESK